MADPLRLLIPAIFATSIVMSGSGRAEPAFSNLVVVGDSLSDSGNAGRSSDGPVWVEHLASELRLTLKASRDGGSNFATGGARLDPRSGANNLRVQADILLRMQQPSVGTLYVVYGGGNDLLAALGQSDATTVVDSALASLKGIIADLVRHGARDILVPNLPDIGMTPAVRARGDKAIAGARELTDQFNGGLQRALTDLAGAPDHKLRIYDFDVHSMAERVRRDPSAFGFKNVVAPCGQSASCEGYLFWDDVHPTTHAHRRLAEAAFRALHPPPTARP
jgi:outer membrane lipase/esterase